MTTEQLEQSYGGRVRQRRPLTEIVQQLLDRIELAGGEVDDGVDALGLELSDKAEAYCAVIRQLEAEAEAHGALAARYRESSAVRDRQIGKLKARLSEALEAVGVEKLKTPTCTVWLQESSSVDVDPKTVIQHYGIDHEFTDIAVSVVKTTIRHALERGEVVEGAKLVTTKHLRLR